MSKGNPLSLEEVNYFDRKIVFYFNINYYYIKLVNVIFTTITVDLDDYLLVISSPSTCTKDER